MAKRKVKIGDNSLNAEQLSTIIQRIDKLEEEKQSVSDDIKQVYLEARGNGYDVKAIKRLRKLISTDAAKRQEEATILKLYADALDIEIDPFS